MQKMHISLLLLYLAYYDYIINRNSLFIIVNILI